MSLLRNKLYLAVTLGHFTVDIFGSMGSVLVTFLRVSLALSTTQIGLAIGAYQLTSAGTQPLFGWLTDKAGSRWLGPGSVLWAASFLALSVYLAQVTHNFTLFMIVFCLSAIGVGAFHPQGTMHAGTAIANRAATATAVFFLFGQSGLAAGPALVGLILDNVGTTGIYVLPLITTPLLFFMIYAMRHTFGQPISTAHSSGEAMIAQEKETVRWGAIGLLVLLGTLRSWVFLGTISFVPKLFQDKGWEATAYGSITGIYWMASAIAGVIGGNLADRFGRRQVVFISLLIGSIGIYFLPLYSGWQAFLLAIITGGFLGACHSIIVVIAQALLPGRKAFAAGVTLGYLFTVGALAAWGIGVMADLWELTRVIQAGTAIGILAALFAPFLPATRETERSQAETVSAR